MATFKRLTKVEDAGVAIVIRCRKRGTKDTAHQNLPPWKAEQRVTA
jgi:hypothetical protein